MPPGYVHGHEHLQTHMSLCQFLLLAILNLVGQFFSPNVGFVGITESSFGLILYKTAQGEELVLLSADAGLETRPLSGSEAGAAPRCAAYFSLEHLAEVCRVGRY
jgi:hypothetical protein